MNLHGIIEPVISFGHNNPIIVLIIGAVLLFLLYRKPKLSLFLLILVLILAVIYSMIIEMSSSGTAVKERLIDKSEQSTIPNNE